MGYEYFIAKRYLTAKRKQAFVSVITFISVLGITIGVMALIIAIALITGFQRDVQSKILGATSHLMISDLGGEGLPDYVGIIDKLNQFKGIKSVSPVVLDKVLIGGPSGTQPAALKGMDFALEKTQSPWISNLERGQIPSETGREGILLGRDLSLSLGAGVGDVVTVVALSSSLSPLGPMPKRKRFLVTGVFSTGLFEFDNSTALIPLSVAQKFFRMEDRVSYLQVMLTNIFDAPQIKETIRPALPPTVYITSWMELNKALFSALKLEKKLLFLTIALIVFVASLNIIATLILMVMEKTRDIGILIAMGATSRNIRTIFFLQGSLIGIIGTAVGTSLGLLCCAFANTFKLIKVPVDIYQISYVPFYINPLDLVLIISVSLLISFLSTIFPSHRASKVDPVVALKYE